jgi:RHS repeat-associated protein
LFTGQQYDGNTGFYHLRARYYQPTSGRFISTDPFAGDIYSPASLHRYLYAANDPANRIDPSGKFSLGEVSFISAMIGVLTLISSKAGDFMSVTPHNGVTQIRFNVAAGILSVNPGRPDSQPYEIRATSGNGACINKPECECIENVGPIPRGSYTINVDKLSNPGLLVKIWRNMPKFVNKYGGDWGSWLVPLSRTEGNPACANRSGFYLHGGMFDGSAGCIDIGGGIAGNETTNKVVTDLILDSDRNIPVLVQ